MRYGLEIRGLVRADERHLRNAVPDFLMGRRAADVPGSRSILRVPSDGVQTPRIRNADEEGWCREWPHVYIPPAPTVPTNSSDSHLPTCHAFQKRIPRVLRAPHHLPPPFPVWPKIRLCTGQGAGDYPPASPLILRPATRQIPAPSGRQHQSHGDEVTRALLYYFSAEAGEVIRYLRLFGPGGQPSWPLNDAPGLARGGNIARINGFPARHRDSHTATS